MLGTPDRCSKYFRKLRDLRHEWGGVLINMHGLAVQPMIISWNWFNGWNRNGVDFFNNIWRRARDLAFRYRVFIRYICQKKMIKCWKFMSTYTMSILWTHFDQISSFCLSHVLVSVKRQHSWQGAVKWNLYAILWRNLWTAAILIFISRDFSQLQFSAKTACLCLIRLFEERCFGE